MADMEEARARMIAKRFGGNKAGASTGGGGSARRKKKTVHKTQNDDKKLSSALKKLNLTPISGIEEVNLFKEDGHIIHFTNPKVQASLQSNTYVVSGNGETKQLQDLFPGILSQMGQENMNSLRQMMEAMGGDGAAAAGAPADGNGSDEDIPDLVENFEEASNK
mmetsp:Transcript_9875/g.14853  ORF Transcript_9875/g.14853 Transcript_9875/m.14853 type:complete len:164 (+) Transcript_9875:84-575(+)|eukprot:CAMPEP_0185024344 /NCGR_PEP_ID=MMETSP1103-20130426/7374_1 /TAXON_ID=36769 /ORGANISM="Paraphysomonas bandaiensis, Strain Caron Lab Isolate" /LENGTH=163 /DNA_ID=CAMNT_0027557281 /DNA_START=79 /DNA_END=570 /DNA_ORIENTATION=-